MKFQRKVRKTRKRPSRISRRRVQTGGFSYAVMEGVKGAALLMPIVIRQGINLLRNERTRTRKRKSRRNTYNSSLLRLFA